MQQKVNLNLTFLGKKSNDMRRVIAAHIVK
jgi:hypothetical protein